jgi:RNA polymerase sigma-B factor
MATPDAVTGAPPEQSTRKPRQRGGTYSGRLLLRMPTTLHEELARASDRDGVSLNQFITGVLASAVDWRREDGITAAGSRGTSPRSRGMTILLAVNIVLVGLAAAAAIGFLVAAWLS